MSVKLMAMVWELDLPPGEKLVLLALADQANDEGRQCWPAVSTIAKRSGQGERTVRRALASLETAKHLTRQHRDGDSSQYHVHPCQIGTPARSAPLPKTTITPAKLAPKPSRTTIPKKDKPSLERAKHEIPEDWGPKEFGADSESRKVVDGWPPGEIERQLEHFRAHHRKKGDRFKSWQDAWSTWVLNSRSFGRQNGRSGTNASGEARIVAAGRSFVARGQAQRHHGPEPG